MNNKSKNEKSLGRIKAAFLFVLTLTLSLLLGSPFAGVPKGASALASSLGKEDWPVSIPWQESSWPSSGAKDARFIDTGEDSILAPRIKGGEIERDQSPVLIKEEEKPPSEPDPVLSEKVYSLAQFKYLGVIRWEGYQYTFYSQSVLPGNGLSIPGRHLDEEGYVVDEDGYIVLASSALRGTVFPTPFGRFGKVYDKGTYGNHLDVYIR